MVFAPSNRHNQRLFRTSNCIRNHLIGLGTEASQQVGAVFGALGDLVHLKMKVISLKSKASEVVTKFVGNQFHSVKRMSIIIGSNTTLPHTPQLQLTQHSMS
jgi:hypothetical protein